MKNCIFQLAGSYIVTGANGLLGRQHMDCIEKYGGNVIGLDLHFDDEYFNSKNYELIECDITCEKSLKKVKKSLESKKIQLKGLVNNAALNPKMDKEEKITDYFENFDMNLWNKEISVGLTGALLATKTFGEMMKGKGGSIVNISSDLGIIAPNQNLYSNSKKPASYSIIKHGIIGLTKYTATYWCDENIRCNALVPGGVKENQDIDFIKRVEELIPLSRMANSDDYQGGLIFLLSGASSYMTGSSLIIDGGRTCW